MKKIALCILAVTISLSANCQSFYYVFLTDKNTVEFNPYEYFDAKAIERRMLQGISLYDSSDFPVNQEYVNRIADLSQEYVGESRWFNMVMIAATNENIARIKNFPFVKNIVQISDDFDMQLAKYQEFDLDDFLNSDTAENSLSKQLLSLQGDYFAKNNINGKGMRIAVFDGGFPNVDTHVAFEHLRENNQIIKTWNFPNKKENVYGWNSHGTMVLSCIAGIYFAGMESKEGGYYKIGSKGKMLGLATGAEFLLARTEIETEPKKEEFWWLQAVEWADKNGANIINSSLGYGIERHYFEELDGKTTIVTKAANMAAAKGILVCNSAGNEGSTENWLKIIAPADADSILTVGGINPSLTNFTRISFSSYGPTADGRMKPNVVAFGDVQAANPAKKSNTAYRNAQGTSFSSPLIAGFAACAWQTNRNLTAMELKSEIEKSASLYPYFDYAYGYGIPQASYFTENQQLEIEKTFEITSDETSIFIKPFVEKLNFLEKQHYLFYNIQNEDGTLDYYGQINLYEYFTREKIKNDATDSTYSIGISKNFSLNNKTLNVFFNGYFQSYRIEEATISSRLFVPPLKNRNFIDVKNQKPSQWGYKAKHFMTGYVAASMFIPTSPFHFYDYAKSYIFDFGVKYKYNVCKWYAIGGNLGFGVTELHYDIKDITYPNLPIGATLKYNKMVTHHFNLEFFQRFRLAAHSFGDVYVDLGIYGGVNVSYKNEMLYKTSLYKRISSIKMKPFDPWEYGVKARLGYGFLAISAQYDLTNSYLYYHTVNLGIEISIPY